MKFGNILKLAMDKQGVTVQEIAMKFCVVERTAYRWYVGDAEPDFERICELSKMMHIDLNQFADIIPDKDLINVFTFVPSSVGIFSFVIVISISFKP